MNIRKRKKKYKQEHGENPPKWLKLRRELQQKPKGPENTKDPEITGNLTGFIEKMYEKRKCRRNRRKWD